MKCSYAVKNLLLSTAILLCLIACRKNNISAIDEMDDPPVYYGESSFKMNGLTKNNYLPLGGLYYGGLINSNYTFRTGFSDSRNFAREGLAFNLFKFKDTSYLIKTSNGFAADGTYSSTSSWFTLLGGDVIIGQYDVDSTKPCVLNITRVDSTTKEFWGTFYGTYKYPDNATPPNNYPKVINITDGSFHTKVLW